MKNHDNAQATTILTRIWDDRTAHLKFIQIELSATRLGDRPKRDNGFEIAIPTLEKLIVLVTEEVEALAYALDVLRGL